MWGKRDVVDKEVPVDNDSPIIVTDVEVIPLDSDNPTTGNSVCATYSSTSSNTDAAPSSAPLPPATNPTYVPSSTVSSNSKTNNSDNNEPTVINAPRKTKNNNNANSNTSSTITNTQTNNSNNDSSNNGTDSSNNNENSNNNNNTNSTINASQTTTVATASRVSHRIPFKKDLGRNPSGIKCQHCGVETVTTVNDKMGITSILIVVVIAVLFWPLCWLPFFVPSCKATSHYCGHCKKKVGETDACA